MSDWLEAKDEWFLSDKSRVFFLHDQPALKMPKKGSVSSGLGLKEKKLRWLPVNRFQMNSDGGRYHTLDLSTPPAEKLPYLYFYKGLLYSNKADFDKLDNGKTIENFSRDNFHMFNHNVNRDTIKIYLRNQLVTSWIKDNENVFIEYDDWVKKAVLKGLPKDWKEQYVAGKTQKDDREEKELMSKLIILKDEGMIIKGTKDKLEREVKALAKPTIKRTFNMDSTTEKLLKTEIEDAMKTVKKTPLDTTFSDIIKGDQTLDYLINRVDRYSIRDAKFKESIRSFINNYYNKG